MVKNVLWLNWDFHPITLMVDSVRELLEKMGINLFLLDTPPQLVKKIHEFQSFNDSNYLIITGVDFHGTEEIFVLPEFFKPKLSKHQTFKTSINGTNVGLMLYQKLFLDDVDDHGVICKSILKPPPLVVLTTYELDEPHLSMFGLIKQANPLSEWIEKFNFDIKRLEKIIDEANKK